MGNIMERDLELADPADLADLHLDVSKVPLSNNGVDLSSEADKMLSKDEVPEDIRAFFGHPLTAATSTLDGGEEPQASALALLHEYQNLPAIDRADLKIGDRYESISDILRADLRRDNGNSDYLMLMNADVDAFLNRDGGHAQDLADAVLEEDENANRVLKVHDPSDTDFMLDLHKDVTSTDNTGQDFPLFDTSDNDPLALTGDIKQEEVRELTPEAVFRTLQDTRQSVQTENKCASPRAETKVSSASPVPCPPTFSGASPAGILHQVPQSGAPPLTLQPIGPAFPANLVRPPPGLIPVSPEAFQQLNSIPSAPMSLVPLPPGVVRSQSRMPTQLLHQLQQPPTGLLPVPPGLLPGPPGLVPGPPGLLPGPPGLLPRPPYPGPPRPPGSPQAGQAVTRPGDLPLVSTVAQVSTSPSLPVGPTQSTSPQAASPAPSSSPVTSQPSVPTPQNSKPGTPQPHTSQPPTPQPGTPLTPTTPRTGHPLSQQQHPQLPSPVQQRFVSQAQSVPTASSVFSSPPAGSGAQGFAPPPSYQDAFRRQPTPVPQTGHFTPQTSVGESSLTSASPGKQQPSAGLPASHPLPSPGSVTHSGPTAFPVTSTLAPPLQHTLPPTPQSSSDSSSVPSSPLPRKDAADSRSCSPDSVQKPSESTKRIIIALTEKLKRNQQQKHIPDHGSQVSLNDINDIIKESIQDKGRLADGLTLDRVSVDQLESVLDYSQVSAASDMEMEWPSSMTASMTSFSPNPPAHSPAVTSVTSTLSSPLGSLPQPASSAPAQFSSPPPLMMPSSCAVFFPETYGYNSLAGRHYPQTTETPSPSPSTTPVSENEAPPLVIQPQDSFLPQTPMTPVQPSVGPYADLKSPDSGFNEACVSPADSSTVFGELSNSEMGGIGGDLSRDRIGKRRRSSASAGIKPVCSSTTKPSSTSVVIPKLEHDFMGYKYVLETNTSTSQRLEEDRMTYLNKGQFYGLTLDYKPSGRSMRSSVVKSLIVVVFREDKGVTDELKSWEFWHSRQHSVKHRILDIDTKNSTGVVANSIDEVAHNAVLIRWNPLDVAAKISVAINCLSTDFSNQKGVKGLPLHIQVDTFEEGSNLPVHRGYCQVKVFCDKGAERKTRDEERRKEAKTKSTEGPVIESTTSRKRLELYHPPMERSEFYSMANLTKKPILFNPVSEYNDPNSFYLTDPFFGSNAAFDDRIDSLISPTKRARLDSAGTREVERVLLYVREGHENVYTALLLQTPTLMSLAHAIEEKYKIPSSNIHNIYKRSKKGILVKMDDNIIRHYSNETTFVISITKNEHILDCQAYDVTLAEIEADSV